MPDPVRVTIGRGCATLGAFVALGGLGFHVIGPGARGPFGTPGLGWLIVGAVLLVVGIVLAGNQRSQTGPDDDREA